MVTRCSRGSGEIVEYLRSTYPAPADAEAHAARGAWRAAGAISLPPRAALARLKELLEEKGFKIVTQVKGPKISERLPKEYVLLHVTAPVAAAKTIEIDPLAPGAVLLPMAIIPAEGGTSVIAMRRPRGSGVALRRAGAHQGAGGGEEAPHRGAGRALTTRPHPQRYTRRLSHPVTSAIAPSTMSAVASHPVPFQAACIASTA